MNCEECDSLIAAAKIIQRDHCPQFSSLFFLVRHTIVTQVAANSFGVHSGWSIIRIFGAAPDGVNQRC